MIENVNELVGRWTVMIPSSEEIEYFKVVAVDGFELLLQKEQDSLGYTFIRRYVENTNLSATKEDALAFFSSMVQEKDADPTDNFKLSEKLKEQLGLTNVVTH